MTLGNGSAPVVATAVTAGDDGRGCADANCGSRFGWSFMARSRSASSDSSASRRCVCSTCAYSPSESPSFARSSAAAAVPSRKTSSGSAAAATAARSAEVAAALGGGLAFSGGAQNRYARKVLKDSIGPSSTPLLSWSALASSRRSARARARCFSSCSIDDDCTNTRARWLYSWSVSWHCCRASSRIRVRGRPCDSVDDSGCRAPPLATR
mmetsp:Transcript_8784/g.26487  ORF Transcript_8784/g.26487 Transcript_8784/m.26487 type:complete len:210 (-) Transcript_8784:191-820(-)